MIIVPGQYLMAVSKEDLIIIRKALGKWKGPYPDGDSYRTPIQVEYQEKETARARELERKIGKSLGR